MDEVLLVVRLVSWRDLNVRQRVENSGRSWLMAVAARPRTFQLLRILRGQENCSRVRY
jgi:hypothetical protein